MTKTYDRAYFDKWYRRGEIGGSARLARKVALAVATAEYHLERPIRSVLDIGCGEGAWRAPLLKLRPKLSYLGFDSSEYAIARYGRVDLLIIDELGYMELDKRGAELLFQVLTEREEKASVAIATNQPFSEWTRTFTDPRLCAAIVDRLTFHGTIIETGTDSYRLAHTRQADSAAQR